MLNAFLYDYKKTLIRNLSLQKLTHFQKSVFVTVGLSMVLYIAAAILAWLWLFIISAVLLIISLIVACRKDATEKKQDKDISGAGASILCTQTQWFIDKRVDTVKKMLGSNSTGLAPLECIDLLLVECDNKLKSTRPSELIQKRIKPIIIPMTIIILSLITAWINIMVPEMNISFEDSFSKYFLSVMQVLASNIILSRTLMVSFVAICVYATAIYLAIVFVIFPAVMSFVDREFLLASELRDVLLYIKHDDSFVKQGTTCASEK